MGAEEDIAIFFPVLARIFCAGFCALWRHQAFDFGLISGLIEDGGNPILIESAALADVLNEFFNFRSSAVGIAFSAELEDMDCANAKPEKAASPEIPEIRIDRLSI